MRRRRIISPKLRKICGTRPSCVSCGKEVSGASQKCDACRNAGVVVEPEEEVSAQTSRVVEMVTDYHLPGSRIIPFVAKWTPAYVPTAMVVAFVLLLLWLVVMRA